MEMARGKKQWNTWFPHKESIKKAIRDGDSTALPDPDLSFEIGPGDLIILPPGWAHDVATKEDSFGIAGNYWDRHHLAGLDLALADEARSEGHEGNKASDFIFGIKKEIAEE